MRVRVAVLTVTTMLLGIGAASSQQDDGPSIQNGLGLYESCIEKGKASSTNWGMCHGFILGVVAGASDVRSSGRPDSCIEDGVTNGQLHDVVEKYLINHPELRHRRAASLILSAVTEAFCKRK